MMNHLSTLRSSGYPLAGPGGEGRIRTSEGIANRFTVCPLWPLGNLSDSKSFSFGRTNLLNRKILEKQ